MRKWLLAFALTALVGVSQAQAGGGLFKHRGGYAASIPGTTTTYSSGYSGYSAGTTATTSPEIKPYSYYVVPPGTARGYYGYGEDQFPYNGRAYGHPYDPWTWPYMSQGYQGSLFRYYDPPVK